MQLDFDIKNPKIIEKITNTDKAKYKVIKYDDKFVCDNDEELGKYRSIILSEDEGRILCYSPPKSITFELFQTRNPDMESRDILVNEVIEGTMISLFWDDRIQQWELATKGAVGANYWFYRTKYPNIHQSMEQKTFRRMFLDALRASASQDLVDLSILDELPKGEPDNRICYNFVLQHPDNHIVNVIENPVLYLIGVYGIQSGCDKVDYISPEIYYGWKVWDTLSDMVKFPDENYDRSALFEVDNASTVGIMLTNTTTGDRTCIENPKYKEKREIRGNHPSLQYQYLCLNRVEKVLDFLGHFPQYKKTFFRFHRQLEDFITQLHQAYMSYYIKKEGKRISKRFFPLIHKMHTEVYLPSISTEKIIMKRAEVKKYISAQPPIEIIYYLNYTE